MHRARCGYDNEHKLVLTHARKTIASPAPSTYEVLGSLRDIITKESKDNAARFPTFDLHVEEDLVGDSLAARMTVDVKLKYEFA